LYVVDFAAFQSFSLEHRPTANSLFNALRHKHNLHMSDTELDQEYDASWRATVPIPTVSTSLPPSKGRGCKDSVRNVRSSAPGRKTFSKNSAINEAYSLLTRDQEDKSRIRIHGEAGIEFDATALQGQAKLVIKRSERFEKRRTNFAALQDSGDACDEANPTDYPAPATLGDFVGQLPGVDRSTESDLRRELDGIEETVFNLTNLLDFEEDDPNEVSFVLGPLPSARSAILSILERCTPGSDLEADCLNLLETIERFAVQSEK
jgi:hypothetical protein